jgi:phosphatidylglycerol:prolipoprotein diacylglycerol transferase
MFIHPDINLVALKIGPIKIYWYGIMYVLAFAIAWGLALYRASKPNSGWTKAQIADLIFYCALGLVIGARIGYMLVYDLPNFVSNPLIIFKTWEGGMSFHGGLIGVIIALLLFAKKTHKNFFAIGDFVVPLAPLGLAAGRMGNFINAELWGRVTNVPWAMIYPKVDMLPRHPSELYECFLEGIVLFVIIWLYSAKPRPRMAISGLFLICYGVFRISLEFFRQPDPQLGFIAFGWLTMGQLLSIPMIIAGIVFMVLAYSRNKSYN